MYPARRYAVPSSIALVYDFVNSRDARHFLRDGVRNVEQDSLATPHELQDWLVDHRLLAPGSKVSTALHQDAITIRESLRAFLCRGTADRRAPSPEMTALEKVMRKFPLVVGWNDQRELALRSRSSDAYGAMAAVVAGVYSAAMSGELDRLKSCPAAECQWVFFDRTKPNTGKWCDSAICGNREKKRAYRRRKKT